jgi:hypothetical protein
MYDLENKKESGKYSGLQDCGTTANAPAASCKDPPAAQPRVDVGPNDIEVGIHRNQGRWVRAAQLPELFCSWDLAYRCTRSGWLRPIVQGKRRTIYRLADILACVQRIEAGELPPPRANKAAQCQGD